MRKLLGFISKALSELILLPVRLYKIFISPLLGNNCRYYPTCSQYAIEALQTHGPIKGLILAVWRIVRCNPFAAPGIDKVPPKGKWKN